MTIRRRFLLLIAALLLSLSYVSLSLAQEGCRDPRRIVGGEKTDIKQHPWQVALTIDGALCGGSIIAHKWILTAAHCFASSTQPNRVRAKAGATNRMAGAWTEVERIVIHDQYNAKTQEQDLALVKLKFPPAGEVIPLAQPDLQLRPCELLEVTGWGRTSEDPRGTISNELLKANLPFIEIAACNAPGAYNGAIRSGMMCAGYDEGGVDSCQGDSGGPLVYRGPDGPVLVGVVSWGEGCARKLKYGVYTRLTIYQDWIAKVITSDRN
jgi:secreted trypsin-like serine protease